MKVSPEKCSPTNQCTRIAMRRFLEIGCACGGVVALRVVLLARNWLNFSVACWREAATGNGAADVSAARRQSIVGGLARCARGPANNGMTAKNER